jgi:hypothetical protein
MRYGAQLIKMRLTPDKYTAELDNSPKPLGAMSSQSR